MDRGEGEFPVLCHGTHPAKSSVQRSFRWRPTACWCWPKASVGIAIGSVSILSEAIHSGVDLLAALVASVAVHAAAKPPDARHPFGHGKVENLSGAFEAALIGIAGIWIIVESVERLLRGGNVHQSVWGMTIMLASSIIHYLVSFYSFRVAKETQSVALEADAWHLRADVWTSLGVAGSLLVAFITAANFPHWNVAWLDPTAAIAVALVILKAAWVLTQNAMADLRDASQPESEQAMIQDALRRHPEVVGGHGARARSGFVSPARRRPHVARTDERTRAATESRRGPRRNRDGPAKKPNELPWSIALAWFPRAPRTGAAAIRALRTGQPKCGTC